MGQIPAKYFPPPTPYGVSPNVGAIGAPTQVDTTSVGSGSPPTLSGPTNVPPGSNFGPPPQPPSQLYQGGPAISPIDQTKKSPITSGGGTA